MSQVMIDQIVRQQEEIEELRRRLADIRSLANEVIDSAERPCAAMRGTKAEADFALQMMMLEESISKDPKKVKQ